MWSGTPEQYYKLYETTAKLLKKEMPYIKVGGYGCCTLLGKGTYNYFINFLTHVKETGSPLDFFSWHTYADKLEDIRENARLAREGLDSFGFTETESILNEWNYFLTSGWGETFGKNGARKRGEMFARTMGNEGAAFTASALIEMCDLPVDAATVYDGQASNMFCTIFDRYGAPTTQYYAFDAFNRVKTFGERIYADVGDSGLHVLASGKEDGGGLCLLIANFNGEGVDVKVSGNGLTTGAEYKLELLEVLDGGFEKRGECTITHRGIGIFDPFWLSKNGVVLAYFERV